MESTFLDFDRVTDLLKNGKTREAKLKLEELGGQTLIIEGNSGGQGALTSFAPTTLLMRVQRAIMMQAHNEAVQGSRTEALAWLSRGRELAAQVLNTSEPNLDTLHLARCLDMAAEREEIAVRRLLGDTQGMHLAEARERATEDFYRTTILARIDALPNDRTKIGVADVRSLVQLYQSQRLGHWASEPVHVADTKS